MNKKILILTAVMIIFIALFLGFIMWNTGAIYIRDYSDKTVLFDAQSIQIPDEIKDFKAIRVVHFWDPKCRRCNEEPESHLSYLISLHKSSNMKFYSVQKPNSKGEINPHLQDSLKPINKVKGMELLPASPSLAVWDEDGDLVYAGPYSEGITCNSSNSFVEPILEALVAGRKINVPGTIAVGCYCDWDQ